MSTGFDAFFKKTSERINLFYFEDQNAPPLPASLIRLEKASTAMKLDSDLYLWLPDLAGKPKDEVNRYISNAIVDTYHWSGLCEEDGTSISIMGFEPDVTGEVAEKIYRVLDGRNPQIRYRTVDSLSLEWRLDETVVQDVLESAPQPRPISVRIANLAQRIFTIAAIVVLATFAAWSSADHNSNTRDYSSPTITSASSDLSVVESGTATWTPIAASDNDGLFATRTPTLAGAHAVVLGNLKPTPNVTRLLVGGGGGGSVAFSTGPILLAGRIKLGDASIQIQAATGVLIWETTSISAWNLHLWSWSNSPIPDWILMAPQVCRGDCYRESSNNVRTISGMTPPDVYGGPVLRFFEDVGGALRTISTALADWTGPTSSNGILLGVALGTLATALLMTLRSPRQSDEKHYWQMTCAFGRHRLPGFAVQ